MKAFLLFIITFASFSMAVAQQTNDSLAVETTLEELFTVCNSAIQDGENTNDIVFERLAPYILYSGSDAARLNKSACDYNKVEDRKIVDKIGMGIKTWLDHISGFKVEKYSIENANNLNWHAIRVSYKNGNNNAHKKFFFFKSGDKYLLGKIE